MGGGEYYVVGYCGSIVGGHVRKDARIGMVSEDAFGGARFKGRGVRGSVVASIQIFRVLWYAPT